MTTEASQEERNYDHMEQACFGALVVAAQEPRMLWPSRGVGSRLPQGRPCSSWEPFVLTEGLLATESTTWRMTLPRVMR
jgi:hypothetical protein